MESTIEHSVLGDAEREFFLRKRNFFARRQSVNRNVPGARDIRNPDRPQQLDKRVNLLLVTRRLNDHLRMRNINNLRAKDTHKTQHFLSFRSRSRSDSDQRHLSLDVWPSSDVLHLAHARQPFTLLDDLLNRAVIAASHNRDARPARIETLTDRDRFNIESPCTEEPDDPR